MKVTQMSSSGKAGYKRPAPVTYEMPPQEKSSSGINLKRIIEHFEKDDYILIGLIAVLVFEGCDDYILLAALGYLFIMGVKQE